MPYNNVIESDSPRKNHHLTAPGAWLPSAAVREPEDERVPWVGGGVRLHEVRDEDLLPWERRILAARLS